jgi:hypothetical protein
MKRVLLRTVCFGVALSSFIQPGWAHGPGQLGTYAPFDGGVAISTKITCNGCTVSEEAGHNCTKPASTPQVTV